MPFVKPKINRWGMTPFRFPMLGWILLILLVALNPVHAARIGDISEISVWDQAVRFFSFKDPSLRYALAGAILLGLTCGLLGSFLVVRKLALVGDTLSHAVLPGVAAGFLWNMDKNPVAIFIVVDLPAPFGPRNPTTSPRATLKLTSSTAVIVPNCFVR